MELKNYETVFILTPVLSDSQMKDTVEKFKQVLIDNGAQITNEENWGLKKLAYPIQHKTTGFYTLLEFTAKPTVINTLEVEFRRDERVMRFLTVALDKHAFEYNKKRKKGEFKKSAEKQEEKV
ncbi:MAG: 30S ribosomal protein S6 [Cytophagaceae bacterium]